MHPFLVSASWLSRQFTKIPSAVRMQYDGMQHAYQLWWRLELDSMRDKMAVRLSDVSMTVRVTMVTLIGIALLGVILIGITASSLDDEMRQQASARQESNMAVAWEVLQSRGADFKVMDGKLLAGKFPVNDTFEVVDRVTVRSVTTGGCVSTTNVQVSYGCCCTLPASSTARHCTECAPSGTAVNVTDGST